MTRERPDAGIDRTLQALVDLAWRKREDSPYRELAQAATEDESTRTDKMLAIIDELHSRFTYAADPIQGEFIGPVPYTPGGTVDADDACLFVMTLAMGVGIPCRIVGARYRKFSWTCFVSYQDEAGDWNNIDPLRQKTVFVPNELVTFEVRS